MILHDPEWDHKVTPGPYGLSWDTASGLCFNELGLDEEDVCRLFVMHMVNTDTTMVAVTDQEAIILYWNDDGTVTGCEDAFTMLARHYNPAWCVLAAVEAKRVLECMP